MLTNKQAQLFLKQLEKYNRIYPNKEKMIDYFEELNNYSTWLKSKDWSKMDAFLQDKKDAVLNKLKLNTSR